MSLRWRRLRVALALGALPLLLWLLLNPQAWWSGASENSGWILIGLLFFCAVPFALVLTWMGYARRGLNALEEVLRRSLALWTPDPGATWLAWAGRCHDLGRARRWLEYAAAEGGAEARLELALAYADGSYGSGGEAAARPLLEALAQEGDPEGMAHLALMQFWGRGRPRDLEAAFRWMRRAAERGQGGAAGWLAAAYGKGNGIEADPAEAAKWRALATDDPLPRPGLLARLRDPGQAGQLEALVAEIDAGMVQAFDVIFADPLLRRGFLGLALAMGSSILLGFLGMLFVGWRAFPVFFIPLPVCLLLALSWRDGRSGYSRAARRTWKAAEEGEVEAAFALGLAFERGDQDHPRDATAARQWYQRAAEAGHPEAAYRLGELLAWGQGGLKDRAAARFWFQRAIDRGHAGAKARLAELDSHAADAER